MSVSDKIIPTKKRFGHVSFQICTPRCSSLSHSLVLTRQLHQKWEVGICTSKVLTPPHFPPWLLPCCSVFSWEAAPSSHRCPTSQFLRTWRTAFLTPLPSSGQRYTLLLDSCYMNRRRGYSTVFESDSLLFRCLGFFCESFLVLVFSWNVLCTAH